MGAVIINIFTHQQTSGASFPTFESTRVASKFLLGIALETVKDIYLDTWDFVASFVSKAAPRNKLHLFFSVRRSSVSSRRELLALVRQFSLLRTQTCCHIILNVGCQMFLLRGNSTALTSPSPHLPPLLQSMLTNILTPLCAEAKPLRERPSPELLSLSTHSQRNWFETWADVITACRL